MHVLCYIITFGGTIFLVTAATANETFERNVLSQPVQGAFLAAITTASVHQDAILRVSNADKLRNGDICEQDIAITFLELAIVGIMLVAAFFIGCCMGRALARGEAKTIIIGRESTSPDTPQQSVLPVTMASTEQQPAQQQIPPQSTSAAKPASRTLLQSLQIDTPSSQQQPRKTSGKKNLSAFVVNNSDDTKRKIN